MSWLHVLLLLILAYTLIAVYIRDRGLFSDRIMFFGPIMAIKTEKVGSSIGSRNYGGHSAPTQRSASSWSWWSRPS